MPLLVRFGSMCCHTSTLRLSTRSSFWEVIGNSNLGVSFALNMLSALIYTEHSYSAMQQVATTDTLADLLKIPNDHAGYKPNCLTTF